MNNKAAPASSETTARKNLSDSIKERDAAGADVARRRSKLEELQKQLKAKENALQQAEDGLEALINDGSDDDAALLRARHLCADKHTLVEAARTRAAKLQAELEGAQEVLCRRNEGVQAAASASLVWIAQEAADAVLERWTQLSGDVVKLWLWAAALEKAKSPIPSAILKMKAAGLLDVVLRDQEFAEDAERAHLEIKAIQDELVSLMANAPEPAKMMVRLIMTDGKETILPDPSPKPWVFAFGVEIIKGTNRDRYINSGEPFDVESTRAEQLMRNRPGDILSANPPEPVLEAKQQFEEFGPQRGLSRYYS